MSAERINPEGLPSPSGFSHATAATGKMVFLAGQTATGQDGTIMGTGVVEQFRLSFRNLLTALAAAGGQPRDLTSLTIYIVDMDDYRAHSAEIGEVWRRLAGNGYPAVAAVGVTRLWDAAALVEIQGTAVISR